MLLLCFLFTATSCGGNTSSESPYESTVSVPRTPLSFSDIKQYLTYKFQWENYSRGFDVIFYDSGDFVLDMGNGTVYTPKNASVAFYKSEKNGYLYRIEFSCLDGNAYAFDINKKSVMVSDNKEFPGAYGKTVYTGGEYSPLKTYLPDVTSLHGLNFIPTSGEDKVISFSKKNFLITLPDGKVYNNDNARLSLSYDTAVNGDTIVYIDVYEDTEIVCNLLFKSGKFIYLNYAGSCYTYKVKTEE